MLPCSSESLELLSLVVTCSELVMRAVMILWRMCTLCQEKLDNKEVVGLRERKKLEGLMKKKVRLMTMMKRVTVTMTI